MDEAPPPKPKGSKKNNGRRVDPRRIDRAEVLWLEGRDGFPLAPRQVEHALMVEFGVSRNSAQRYLKYARDRIAKRVAAAELSPGAWLEKILSQFNDAFSEAKRLEEPSAMVQATQRTAEALGLTKQQVKLDAKVSGLGDLLASVPDDDPDPGADPS